METNTIYIRQIDITQAYKPSGHEHKSNIDAYQSKKGDKNVYQ